MLVASGHGSESRTPDERIVISWPNFTFPLPGKDKNYYQQKEDENGETSDWNSYYNSGVFVPAGGRMEKWNICCLGCRAVLGCEEKTKEIIRHEICRKKKLPNGRHVTQRPWWLIQCNFCFLSFWTWILLLGIQLQESPHAFYKVWSLNNAGLSLRFQVAE